MPVCPIGFRWVVAIAEPNRLYADTRVRAESGTWPRLRFASRCETADGERKRKRRNASRLPEHQAPAAYPRAPWEVASTTVLAEDRTPRSETGPNRTAEHLGAQRNSLRA
jgi:hypothetical protein